MGKGQVGGYIADGGAGCGGGGAGAENRDGEGQEGIEEVISHLEMRRMRWGLKRKEKGGQKFVYIRHNLFIYVHASFFTDGRQRRCFFGLFIPTEKKRDGRAKEIRRVRGIGMGESFVLMS